MTALVATIMSVSCSECFSDLLCGEESSGILSEELSPAESSSDVELFSVSDDCCEESIAGFIEDERNFVPGVDYLARFRSQSLDASARAKAVAWILKVHSLYGFHPLTAYLAVNYLDRFLYARQLPQADGWPLQLLSVACLSLAAKMEEPLVPCLLDFQVKGAKYIFEPRTIQRMELLVLTVLDWKLRSVTPFSFIGFFACKLDPVGASIGFLMSRATEIILSNIQEASFLEYWPSCIAAAAIISAADETPNFPVVNNYAEQAESWCDGLSKEKIAGCCGLMKEILSSATDSSTSSSTSSSSSYKRRKLNNWLWVDDDKGSSE